MRIVVTGASGNVGTAVVEALLRRPEVDSVVGVCRRPHDWKPDGTTWVWADVASDDLTSVVAGADAVIHLAWLFQPMRDPRVTWRANVQGSRRVLDAVSDAGVPVLVVASSVGAYSARRNLEPVDESWPTDGVPQAAYSREKAYVERVLDRFERDHPEVAVARMRPAFIFRRAAATEQRRIFLGPLAPRSLLRPGRVPVLPLPRDLRLQTLHSRDVAEAYATAALAGARGAFNLAAEPVLDARVLAEVFEARWVPFPAGALRAGTSAAYRSRLLPTAPELFDLLMSVPMMRTDRAGTELGWEAGTSADEAVRAFLEAPTDPGVPDTPPLAARTSGPVRGHEIVTGLGRRP